MAGALAGLCHIFLKYLEFWFTYFMKNGISLILDSLPMPCNRLKHFHKAVLDKLQDKVLDTGVMKRAGV